jgi:hypothetical protein
LASAKVTLSGRFATTRISMVRLSQHSSTVAFLLLLLLSFFEMVHTRYRWVGEAAFKHCARGRCFWCLERGHQVSTCREPLRCIRCRRPGHRDRFCRARFPIARPCSSNTCACSPREHAPLRAESLSALSASSSLGIPNSAEVVCRSSWTATSPPSPSPRCYEEFNVNASFDSHLHCQFALMRMELT